MHTLEELRQKQSLSLASKVIMTKARIKSWHEHFDGNVYISFSGGKDSTVLKHIVQSMYSDVPAVFCNTGLEYPEVRQFATSQENVIIIRPKMSFKDVLNVYGYPIISKEQSQYIYEYRHAKSETLKDIRLNGKGTNKKFKISEKWKYLIDAPFNISGKCCDIMKKLPFKAYEKETGRKPIVGTMTEESQLRMTSWLRTGCNAFNGSRQISKPLSFWTEQDILQYIVMNDIRIASVYGEIIKENGLYKTTGLNRTGCMFCMYGLHLEKYPNRFQIMQQTHPKQYKYCMEDLGIKNILQYMGIADSIEFELLGG